MFSGLQEIALILLIILGLITIPRMIKPPAPVRPALDRRPAPMISWKLRLAVVISIFWPVVWALHLKPWQRQPILYFVVGVAPVVLGWSIKWVFAGMKRNR